MHPPRILVLATILGALAAGCTPAPPPTPSPVPTVPSCVPEFGGTPFPCTQAEYEASLKTQARYAEAERVYREMMRLATQEAVDREPTPSQELLALTGGEVRRLLPEVRTNSLKSTTLAGSVEVRSMRPVEHIAGEVGSLAMIACVDRTKLSAKAADGTTRTGTVDPERIIFDDASEMVVVKTGPEAGAPCE